MLHKKIFGLIVFSLLMLSNGYAAYLKNVPQKITQPDGAIVYCFASGDEFYNWLHDSAGFTIIQDPETGFYVYAVQDGEELIASEYVVGRVNPVTVGLTVGANISTQAIMSIRSEFENNTPKLPVRKAGDNKGLINNIVIFVIFAEDTVFSKNFNYMEMVFNDSSSFDANSMYNFYRLTSYGKLYINTHFFPDPSGNTIVAYQDTALRSFFMPYNANTNPNGFRNNERTSREHALLGRAIDFTKQLIPSGLDLDYDGDGRVDNVCFIITGEPIAGGGILWPHRWSLYTRYDSIHGKRIYDYNLNLADINGNASCAGVITHEMMHTLGAPDMYRYDERGNNVVPMGNWDLMASTNYTSPQGLGAYMKYQYGRWIDSIPEITSPGTYTLYPSNGNSPEKTAYKIYPYRDTLPNEYLVLEYRNTASNIFERNLSGSGILIYRINDKYEGNAYSNDEAYIFRPNGTLSANGTLTQANFSSDVNRTEFGYNANPYPFYYNGFEMENILITDITNAGDSIQFTVGLPPLQKKISITPQKMLLECPSGRNNYIDIETDFSWKMTNTPPAWIQMTDTIGRGNKRFSFRIEANNDSTEATRTCTLYFSELLYDSKQDSIIITQKSCNYTAGIDKINQNAKITVFPNPTNGQLTIENGGSTMLTDRPLREAEVEIYDLVGRKLQSKIVDLQSETHIDVSHLANGMYFLKIDGKTVKFIKE